MALEADDQTRQRQLLAALLGAPAPPAASDDDEDTGPPPKPLAQALAGGGVAAPPAGGPPLPPVPPSAAGAPPGTHYAAGPGAPMLIRDDQGALGGGGPLGSLFGALTSPLTGLAKTIGIGGAPPSINLPTTAAAPAGGAPAAGGQPIAGQASDIGAAGAEDPNIAGLRQLHAAKVAEHDQYLAAGDKVRAAGGDPAPYYKLAGEATKEADEINLKAWEYQKETGSTHTLTPDEMTKKGLSDGVYQQDAKGNITQIGGTKSEDTWTTKIDPQTGLQYQENDTTKERKYTTAAEPKIIEQTDPVTGVKKAYSITYENGRPVVNEIVPPAGAPAPQSPLNNDANANLQGEEYLKTLPPEMRRVADAVREIAEYQLKLPPTGGTGGASVENRNIREALFHAYPTYNEQQFNSVKQGISAFNASGGTSPRAMVDSVNTLTSHFGDLSAAIERLDNQSPVAALNYANNITSTAGSDHGRALADYRRWNDLVSNELTKLLRGGQVTDAEKASILGLLDENQPIQSQREGMVTFAKAMKGKGEALQGDWQRAAGDVYGARHPLNLVYPTAEKDLADIDRRVQLGAAPGEKVGSPRLDPHSFDVMRGKPAAGGQPATPTAPSSGWIVNKRVQ